MTIVTRALPTAMESALASLLEAASASEAEFTPGSLGLIVNEAAASHVRPLAEDSQHESEAREKAWARTHGERHGWGSRHHEEQADAHQQASDHLVQAGYPLMNPAGHLGSTEPSVSRSGRHAMKAKAHRSVAEDLRAEGK